MKRVNTNFIIDVAALLALLLLVSTGLILEYRLPPGSGGHEPYGYGHRALDRPIMTIWGWSRHAWGEFHFWIACFFVLVLAIHLILHWKWIVSMCKNLTSNCSHVEMFVLIAGLATFVGLMMLLLVGPKNQTSLREQQALQTPTEARVMSE
jgi:hypothetical protein